MDTHPPTLQQVVAANPFDDYQTWWQLGGNFSRFMAQAIVSVWRTVAGVAANDDAVSALTADYLRIVYRRALRPTLVPAFFAGSVPSALQSGEFDALSYAFFYSAFDALARQEREGALTTARRHFTQQVGKRFYAQVHDHLGLELPAQMQSGADFNRLKNAIEQLGGFLHAEGYVRDHFGFSFDVEAAQAGIHQSESRGFNAMRTNQTAYALYEMGYPVILPSAVYLYNTIGEAQHHSSRTIEELFARVGYAARERDDFDPSHYPPDRVVELWEIRRRG